MDIFAEHRVWNGYEVAIVDLSGGGLAEDAEDGGEAGYWTGEKSGETNGYRGEGEGLGACD